MKEEKAKEIPDSAGKKKKIKIRRMVLVGCANF